MSSCSILWFLFTELFFRLSSLVQLRENYALHWPFPPIRSTSIALDCLPESRSWYQVVVLRLSAILKVRGPRYIFVALRISRAWLPYNVPQIKCMGSVKHTTVVGCKAKWICLVQGCAREKPGRIGAELLRKVSLLNEQAQSIGTKDEDKSRTTQCVQT